MAKFTGKVALVTGASYGVGRAVAIGLAREGCDTVLVARTNSLLAETAARIRSEGRRALVCSMDIADPVACGELSDHILREYGRIDFLVHCAFGHVGEDQGHSILDVSPDELRDFLNASVLGTWLITRSIAPHIQATSGRMVYVVADWGFPQHNIFLGTPPGVETALGSEAFVSAKYAVTGFVNAAERMLGIQTCGIYPGIIASGKPSATQTGARPAYFDLDDSETEIELEEAYAGGWAIPLRDIVDSITFALSTRSVPKAILLKPAAPDYDGLHV